ncbi:MAG: hypothetical protein ACOH2V_01885 [Candidatus Saccharimonadaceae bacterium]
MSGTIIGLINLYLVLLFHFLSFEWYVQKLHIPLFTYRKFCDNCYFFFSALIFSLHNLNYRNITHSTHRNNHILMMLIITNQTKGGIYLFQTPTAPKLLYRVALSTKPLEKIRTVKESNVANNCFIIDSKKGYNSYTSLPGLHSIAHQTTQTLQFGLKYSCPPGIRIQIKISGGMENKKYIFKEEL